MFMRSLGRTAVLSTAVLAAASSAAAQNSATTPGARSPAGPAAGPALLTPITPLSATEAGPAVATISAGSVGCGAVDVASPTQNTCMARFQQGDLAQSFIPNAEALCGASVTLTDDAGSDVTVGLWDALPNAGGNLLAEGTAFAVPAGGEAIVDFGGSVAVTPGDTYFLVFTGSEPTACIAGDTGNPYPDGNVFANAGFLVFPTFDYTFAVFAGEADPCPADCANGDGVVDFDDLLSVLAGFGGSGACDIDGNGVVDFNDLVTLLASFGPCP